MKEFFKRWKKGIMTMPVSQQVKSKMVGQIGTIVGITLASIVMVTKGMWYLILFMLFFIFLQFIDFIGTKQQYEQIKKIEASLYGGKK